MYLVAKMKSFVCRSILLSILISTDFVTSLLTGHGVSYRSQYFGLDSQLLSRLDMVTTDLSETLIDGNTERRKEIDWSTVFVNALIKSPLYTPIVAMARDTMIKTAASVGVDWKGKALALRRANPDWNSLIETIKAQKSPDFTLPSYYMQPFHGYTEGNLCLDAALEQELAGILHYISQVAFLPMEKSCFDRIVNTILFIHKTVEPVIHAYFQLALHSCEIKANAVTGW